MDRLPPEICLLVMEMVPCLSTLGNLILSRKRFCDIFYTHQHAVLKSVIKNQFGRSAREAVFLAAGKALGATSDESRVQKIKSLHLFSWTDHLADCHTLKGLLGIGQVVETLACIFVKSMASELWMAAIDSKPPESFRHTKLRFKRVLYLYWILCQLFRDSVPELNPLTSLINLHAEIFEEFYRPLSVREWLGMAFFEECFFPRFMRDICGEFGCELRSKGLCYFTLHRYVFTGGPEELLRLYLYHPKKLLTRNYMAGEGSLFLFKGLRENVAIGVESLWDEKAGDSDVDEMPESYQDCFKWAIFELDGLDKQRQDIVKSVCGDVTGAKSYQA